MKQIKPVLIGYIQTDIHTSMCPFIYYGLMTKEYMHFIVDYNYNQGYITKLKPVYKRESVCKYIEKVIEEW